MNNSATYPSRPRGRFLTPVGLALGALGVAGCAVQFWLQRLAVPWYMPALAFLGAALVAVAWWQRRTAWRLLALAALVALGGLELTALLAVRLPPYTGPVVVTKPFPAFEAKRSDGTPFRQSDLVGGHRTALVFFRGRW